MLRLLLLCHRLRLLGQLQQCPMLLQPFSTCSKSRGSRLRLLLQLLLLLLHLKHGKRRLYCQHLLLHHQLLLHQALLLQQLTPLHLLPELIFQASYRVGLLLLVELRPHRANLQRFLDAERDALLANSNVLVRLFLPSLLLLALSALTCLHFCLLLRHLVGLRDNPSDDPCEDTPDRTKVVYLEPMLPRHLGLGPLRWRKRIRCGWAGLPVIVGLLNGEANVGRGNVHVVIGVLVFRGVSQVGRSLVKQQIRVLPTLSWLRLPLSERLGGNDLSLWQHL